MDYILQLLDLFWSFFKIGAFTFGGGYAMLPLIQSAVLEKGWLDSASLMNFIAISESTPGPFAVNIATFIGVRYAGFLGSLCATLGVVLPSFIIILIVARCYKAFRKSKVVEGLMTGLRPAVIGMIGSALLNLAKTVFLTTYVNDISLWTSVFREPGFYVSLVLFAAMSYLAIKKKVHPIIIILISAGVGIAAGYLLNLPV